MSSDDDVPTLMAAFQRGGRNARAAPPEPPAKSPTPTADEVVTISDSSSPEVETKAAPARSSSQSRRLLHIHVSPPRNRDEYVYYEPEEVSGIPPVKQ